MGDVSVSLKKMFHLWYPFQPSSLLLPLPHPYPCVYWQNSHLCNSKTPTCTAIIISKNSANLYFLVSFLEERLLSSLIKKKKKNLLQKGTINGTCPDKLLVLTKRCKQLKQLKQLKQVVEKPHVSTFQDGILVTILRMIQTVTKDLHGTAFNFQTCIVFPRPISSPRIQPCSHSKQRFIHFTPSSWYPRK